MKIAGMTVENFKRIKLVEVKPDGNVVQITGRNDQGKSSLFDAIECALTGTKSHPTMPIRVGEDSARVQLDLGRELIVTREFRKVPPQKDRVGDRILTRVIVQDATRKGKPRLSSPQAVLDAIYDERCIDPSVFVRASAAEQYATLQDIVGIDAASVDKANKADYDERRDINRYARAIRANADAIPHQPDAPDEPVDAEALHKRFSEAVVENAERREEMHRRDALNRDHSALKHEASELRSGAQAQHEANVRRAKAAYDEAGARAEAALQAATHRAAECIARADAIGKELHGLKALPAEVPTADIEAEISTAQERNAAHERKLRRAGLVAQYDDLDSQSKAISGRIEKRKTALAKQLEAADMPVDGLTLADGAVLYNGIPYEQGSTSVKYRVAFAIARRTAGELRTVLIRNGNDFDSTALAAIAEDAEREGFQVLMERVDETGKIGIVIEDGQIKETSNG